MIGREFVARNRFCCAEVGIEGVKVQPVSTWNQRKRFVDVLPQLLNGAGLARIVAGGLDAASAECSASGFKAADVIALPAVQRDRNRFQPLQGGFSVDAPGGVYFAGPSVLFCAHLFWMGPVYSSRLRAARPAPLPDFAGLTQKLN